MTTPYEKVQLARHPKRPYTGDVIENLFEDFVELAGDRRYGNDHAVVTGWAKFDGKPVCVVGHQKGRDTNERKHRNFGMPKPEGYRKALRLMKAAEKFGRPVITFIDTPGAYPGIDAEERGQAEAIAYNLHQMARLRVPVVTVVLGEGGSGGALAIGICDKLLMLENSVYSVISPEGCAAILWKSGEFAQQASECLKLTADDLKKMKIADVVLDEVAPGAHDDYTLIFTKLKSALKSALDEVEANSISSLLSSRYAKLRAMGVWTDLK